ncbi:hypothetical protein L8R94_18810, partial [Vibrio aestuarianus]|uniref:hypothetical protein n=1 Tax=Vibrio aestuarianus TaxID=28171 RepID=UPI00246A0B8D|nr:hypothetical protein [Vibrio aestuarianus]MDH5873808.1 hypothetical protein [Vibrio aestuarianus]MDH5885280.1 hypothetical protein [Vibrio aestuarianus]MDH5948202.1 hypothetical protein [Vibrio aestuarianus]MDH5964209.1 hypothetical protein [Vibrio aestuarianus]
SHNKQFKWILNAWQFYYALGKVFYGAMRRLGQCVVHHLIGRYSSGQIRTSKFNYYASNV